MSERAYKIKNICETSLFLIISLSSITNLIKINNITFIQPQEIVFLISLPFIYLYLRNTISFTRLDKLILFYLSIFLCNLILNPSIETLIEVFGTFYLITLYFIVSRILVKSNNINLLIENSILGLLITSILTGLISYTFHALGITDRFMYRYYGFPYFGDVWRLNGFTWSNLLLSCISFCLFFLPKMKLNVIYKMGLTLIGFTIGLLTYSKEIIVLLSLFIFQLYSIYNNKFSRILLISYSAIISVPVIFFTFFVVKPTNMNRNDLNINNERQISKDAILKIGNLECYPTTYFFLFKSSIEMIKENPLSGIGSGKFYAALNNLKYKYPEKFTSYDTHDFYWGQTAELGLLYILFLFFLFREILKIILNKNNLIPEKYHLTISLIFMYFLICYLVGGSKHYRHFWIFLGIVNAFILRRSEVKMSNEISPQLE